MAFQVQDRADLGRFGYAQELFRGMGGFSNFAISFSIISILTGAVTLFGYGLEMGGPLEMTLGWPVATVFTLLVAVLNDFSVTVHIAGVAVVVLALFFFAFF